MLLARHSFGDSTGCDTSARDKPHPIVREKGIYFQAAAVQWSSPPRRQWHELPLGAACQRDRSPTTTNLGTNIQRATGFDEASAAKFSSRDDPEERTPLAWNTHSPAAMTIERDLPWPHPRAPPFKTPFTSMG